MFGRSKGSEASADGVRVVKHKDKSTSEATVSTRFRPTPRPLSGRYEARCDEHGYSLTGLPREDAEAFAEIHAYEQHDR